MNLQDTQETVAALSTDDETRCGCGPGCTCGPDCACTEAARCAPTCRCAD